MLMHGLGFRLGKTVGEIEAMPYQEFVDWIAYFDLTNGK